MAKPVETLGHAAYRGMILRVECACGNLRFFKSDDLVKYFDRNRRLDSLGFRCAKCAPEVKVRALDVDYDRRPRIKVARPKGRASNGKLIWMFEDFR